MGNSQNQIGRAGSSTPTRLHFLGRLFVLFTAALILVPGPARADETEDRYMQIYGLIQDADAFATRGQPAKALAKYQEAAKALQTFRTDNMQWNPQMVSFRLNYLAEKITALSAKPAESAGATASPGATEEPATKAAAAPSAPPVKLIGAGAEPRAALRLHPKVGDQQKVGMTIRISVGTKVGETEAPAMKMPSIQMTMDLAVKSVAENGDIAYDMVMGEPAVTEEPGAMPQVVEAMKAAFAKAKGLSGSGTMSSRAFSKGTEIKVPPDTDAQTRQVMEQINDGFSQVAATLPEEPVGVGAKWEVKMPIKSQGMMLDQTATYELVSVEGDRLALKTTVAQRAANQKIQNPAMPAVKLDLIKMTGASTGTVTIDLTRVLPVEAATDFHSDSSMSMEMGGQNQPMTVATDVKFRLESK